MFNDIYRLSMLKTYAAGVIAGYTPRSVGRIINDGFFIFTFYTSVGATGGFAGGYQKINSVCSGTGNGARMSSRCCFYDFRKSSAGNERHSVPKTSKTAAVPVLVLRLIGIIYKVFRDDFFNKIRRASYKTSIVPSLFDVFRV